MNSFRRVIRKGVVPCLQKTFSFSVIFSLVMQPMAAPILLGAFVFSVPTKVIAQETEPVEEVAPVAEEEPAPVEEVTPEATPTETPAEESTPAEEVTPVTPEETPEVISPTEEVVTSTSDDQTKTEEDKKTEEVSEAESLEGDICLSSSQSITETTDADWTLSDDGKKASTKENIALGVEYHFPGNEDVKVVFTCLSKDPAKRSPLSIEELDASDIHLPAGVVAAGEHAYDITTEMENGTFKYDLELPKIASGDFDISYIEKSAEEVVNAELTQDDVKKVEDKKVDNKSESVEATELDHFTIFVLTNPALTINTLTDPNWECQSDSDGADDQPGQKDLTQLCFHKNSIDPVKVIWDWDETSLSGNNSGDACTLFDINNNGNADYAICVSWGGNQAQLAGSPLLYSCNDTKGDRCAGPTARALTAGSVCSVGNMTPGVFDANDTAANCTINLADVGGQVANTLDVCSYPSGQPNSDPSDCVLLSQNKGNLEVTKNVVPDDATTQWNVSVAGSSPFTATLVGDDTTGIKAVIPGSYTITETSGSAGTIMANYGSTWSCVDSVNNTTTTTTGTGTSLTVSVAKGHLVNCTFTNTRVNNATLTIIKDAVPNDAQDFSFSTTGTGLSIFSLDDDGDATLSNTKVFSNLGAGTYSVTEGAVAGWAQTSATCTGGQSPNNINLSAGGNVTCTFTNTKQATLTLVKTVTNNNGGSATAGNFQGKIDGTNVAWGVATPVTFGAHIASETNLSGYTAGVWGGDCADGGSVTLAAGENKTCTITNDDQQAFIIVNKTVVNDNGGNASANDFALKVGGNAVLDEVAYPVNPGAHTASETTLPGYTAGAWGGDCATNGNVTVALGQTKTCTITNDDQAATLIVKKVLPNNNGGTAIASQFSFSVNGADAVAFQAGGENQMTVNAGTYSVVETNPMTGYALSYDKCSNVVIPNGGTATCTITNDDIAPKLTVTKVVVNDDGGTLQTSAVPLFVDTTSVTTGVQNTFVAGAHVVSETAQTGYSATISGDCASNGGITLAPGDVRVCTITNNDIQPTLTVIKIVDNNSGGNLSSADFTMQVNSASTSPTPITFPGSVIGTVVDVNAGSYNVNEVLVPGYTANYSADCTGTIAPGGHKVCTITNDDQAPTLTLVKTVVTDNGGTKVVADFPLFVNGIPVTSEVATTLASNTLYTATETSATGYTASVWGTDCASNGTITLKPGENKVCTITNDDQAASLTVVKHVVNDNGGTLLASNFTMNVTGTNVSNPSFTGNEIPGTTVTLHAGAYSVDETAVPGYAKTLGNDCVGTIANGEHKTCTITNDDTFGKIIVKKETIPEGSTRTFTFDPSYGDDFVLTDNGQKMSGTLLPGTYSVSENFVPGWMQTGVICDDGSQPGAISLVPGEIVTCTFTNTQMTNVRVVKDALPNDAQDFVFTNNFGLGQAPTFTLDDDADGTLSNTSQSYELLPGTYVVTEASVAGWDKTGATCDNGSNPSAIEVTPGESTITCTFTNTKKGHLIVQKTTLPAGDGTSFTVNTTSSTGGTITGGGAGSVTDATDKDYEVTPGTYSVAETVPGGWAKTQDTCQGVVVAAGETKTCLITNTKAANLTLIKNVITNNGGDALSTAWTLDAVGPTPISGITGSGAVTNVAVTNGTYTLSESGGPSGYTASAWSCTNNITVTNSQITLTPGQSTTCTITNDDIAPQLTVIKHVINSNGGDKVASDFTMNVTGTNVSSSSFPGSESGIKVTLNVGAYSVDETATSGYTKTLGDSCSGTIALGETKTCTITNDDQQAYIIVDKTVDNKNGGSANADDFKLTVDDNAVLDEVAYPVNPGAHTASETTLLGYTAGAWGGDCDSEGSVTVALGETKTCSITNDDIFGRIIIQKETLPDKDQTSFSFTASYNQEGFNLSDGQSSESGILIPDTYSVAETETLGWDPASATCDDGSNPASISLESNETVTCTFTNEKRGQVTVTKVDDVDEDGVFDEGESTLSNWEMNLGGTSQKTVEGTTTFTNLIKGEYTLGETGQDGWNQTNIYCGELTQERENQTGNLTLSLVPGETKECFVLNHFVDPLLTIEKTNDSFPAVEAPGDVVTYTLKVKATENSVEEVTLTDLPPAGFTYVAGSANASTDNVSHTGTTPALTHEYASPGVWSLGDVADGETITLTYQARISGSQDEGIYNDLAYAGGSSARGAQVLATDVSDSDNFADTRVAVALAETNKVKIDEDKEVETDKKKEYVLGAALPATGATTSLLALAFALMLAGGVLILSDRRKKLMKVFVLGMVMAGSLFGGAAKAASVPEGLAVSMEDPDAAVTSSNFKIGFVALDIQGKDLGRTVEIACFSGTVQYASYTLIPGGSSGDCQVNSTAMPVAGTYDFYVTATVDGEGGGTLPSNDESVKLVTGAPGTPREYDRDESTCDDKISFRTDSDGGRTVKVEAYRSKNKTFAADSSTLVATLTIGSDTEGTITTTPPSCHEDYWYAIRAVDADGIGSDFVGDVDVNVTNKTSTTTITTPGASASGGALPVAEAGTVGEGEAGAVEGAATEGQGDQGVLGEMTGDESQDQAGTWNWAQNHKWSLFFILLIMGGILYYFFYVRRTASTGQGS